MRICHVIATDHGWGGLERCVTDLATFQSAEHTVAVVGTEDVLQRMGPAVRKIIVPMHLSRRHPKLLWAVRKALMDFKPDVIHAHAGKGASLVNHIRWFMPRIPKVATIHGTKRNLRFLRNFDRIMAVSRRAGQCLGSLPFTVVWNAIPPQSIPATPPDLSPYPFLRDGRLVFAAVGRLVEEKAFDVLLQAMVSVDACLWIIGDGALRKELEDMVEKLHLKDRVWFSGFRQDVASLMCLADVMVISSRREGFPLALVEMLHLRRPVIGTRVAGVEEILPDQWLCEPEDVAGLANLLKKAIGKHTELTEEFEPVFDLAARELCLESAVRKIEVVYREAISAAKP